MCALHQINGKRFNRYHELGQYAFGQTLGLWLVVPCQVTASPGYNRLSQDDVMDPLWMQSAYSNVLFSLQLIVMVGLDIVYCVTGGTSMKFVYTVSPSCSNMRLHAS